jgi:hypothetical protein
LRRRAGGCRWHTDWAAAGTARRTSRLVRLAEALRARYDSGGKAEDLHAAAHAFQEAALETQCAPSERLAAAREWGALHAGIGDWERALEGYTTAVGLLPAVAPRQLAREDQEFWLGRCAGLGADAAACAVRCGRPALAVGLLEQARGVMLAYAFDADSDLTRLRETAPDLADRFERLRTALDTVTYARHPLFGELAAVADDGGLAAVADDGGLAAVADDGLTRGSAGRGDVRQRLAAEWRELTEEIRTRCPELGLLRPVREWDERELREVAQAGPVVLVSTSPFGSDALVVTEHSVSVVPLPLLDPQSVAGRRQGLEDAMARVEAPGTSRRESLEAQREVRAVLDWLWQAAAGPVLGYLGLTDAPRRDRLPRIWWSPAGALGALPLHAAAPADDGLPGALDHVVSSYTPTLRALHHARELLGHTRERASHARERLRHTRGRATRERAGQPPGGGLLVVAVGEADGVPPLPGAYEEAQHIARLHPGATVLSGSSATRDTVVPALARHAYAHFACHAQGDAQQPSRSRLVLHDHATSPLTVRELAGLRLTGVRLAFLSSCDTLRTSSELADEAVHIVSAFHMAGFPHVVGALWRLDDVVASRTAASVHEALRTGSGSGTLDVDHTAQALHAAVRGLRDDYPDTPSLWACPVHAGP